MEQLRICRNCHRGLSDDQRNQPPSDSEADLLLHAIGRFLLGLADIFARLIEPLRRFGLAAIERAAPTGDAK
jgi:hypothetical protein